MMRRLSYPCLALSFLLLCQLGLSQLMHPDTKKDLILHKRQQASKMEEDECLEGLVESYGLFSTGTVVEESLATCPSSPNTCCQYDSQKIMIYEMKNDLRKLEKRLKDQDEIIFSLLKELKLDMRYIERFKERQQLQRMSSCKAMGTKLSFHDIDRVASGLEEARESMLEFVKSAHKGVYCALCSPEAQRHIDLDNGILKLSHKFCRSVIVNTIKPMLYLHYEFKRFLNMMARFFQNCDAHGAYHDFTVPDEVVFEYSPDEKVIHNCWKFRNDPDWVKQCSAYCDKFNTMDFSQFFEPNLGLYMRITAFLKHKRMHLNLVERTDDNLHYDSEIRDFPINPTTVGVIDNSKVEDNEHKEGDYEQEEVDALKPVLTNNQIKLFLERFKKNNVVAGDIGAHYSLAVFSYRYSKKGIDFHTLGKDAVSTDALLRVVEAKMNAANKTGNTIKPPAPAVPAVPPAPAGPKPPGARELGREGWTTADSSRFRFASTRSRKSRRNRRKTVEERPFFN